MALSGVIFVLVVQLRIVSKENQSLAGHLDRRESEIKQLHARVSELDGEIASLVESRFPHLYPLSFDKVIGIRKDYVKNIVFTVAGTLEKKVYEYKIVFENQSADSVYPEVTIFVFDRIGLQVGASSIHADDLGQSGHFIVRSGETRSYSAKIKLDNGSRPEYFMVRIDG